jgi:hypothetical protein
MKASAGRPKTSKPRGMTPMTVTGAPSIVSCCPMIPVLPPNCRSHAA